MYRSSVLKNIKSGISEHSYIYEALKIIKYMTQKYLYNVGLHNDT